MLQCVSALPLAMLISFMDKCCGPSIKVNVSWFCRDKELPRGNSSRFSTPRYIHTFDQVRSDNYVCFYCYWYPSLSYDSPNCFSLPPLLPFPLSISDHFFRHATLILSPSFPSPVFVRPYFCLFYCLSSFSLSCSASFF
jgi:hypothetical protein